MENNEFSLIIIFPILTNNAIAKSTFDALFSVYALKNNIVLIHRTEG